MIPMTPETALENAVKALYEARHEPDPGSAATLVRAADVWARLHIALVNAPKEAQPEPVADMSPTTIRDLGPGTEQRSGGRLTLPFAPELPPTVRVGGVDHEVDGWDFEIDGTSRAILRLKLIRKPVTERRGDAYEALRRDAAEMRAELAFRLKSRQEKPGDEGEL